MFDQSVAWLRRHRVLLPGATVLERLVASVREQADERLYATVARHASLRRELSGLLMVPEGARMSELERLRREIRLYRRAGRVSAPPVDAFVELLRQEAPALSARTAIWPRT
ncbi:hypothetical protein [Nonomuraea basaltis]|uniref:hypothetical protein n=1 Tax=Nonomuraea basaltis TaxID=2495887 RepID=UPI001F11202D|nr:hypothetical protein [Nonomuraea basaltis]